MIAATVPVAPLPAPSTTTRSRQRLSEAKVSPNGNVGIGGKLIQLGAPYRRQTVIGAVHNNTITVYDQHGTLIRTVTTTPAQRYYGLGRRTPNRPH